MFCWGFSSRRSCIQTLETKVAPILAGILAYLDTNDNLKILQGDCIKWKQKLWHTYLNKTEALTLQVCKFHYVAVINLLMIHYDVNEKYDKQDSHGGTYWPL